MTSKFKKGDKVKLKKGIKEHVNYGGIYYWDYMKFSEGIVRNVLNLGIIIVFSIEGNPYEYSTEMLEKV